MTIVTLALSVLLQAPQQATPACDCAATFDRVVSEVEHNYSGFSSKITAANRKQYDAFVQKLRQDVKAAKNDSDCQVMLGRYTAFFQDGHIGIDRLNAYAPPDTAELRRRAAHARAVALSESELRARITADPHPAPVEGIWRSLWGANYRVAIYRDAAVAKDSLVAVILQSGNAYWSPGQVKFLLVPSDSGYRGRFFMGDHSDTPMEATLSPNLLRMNNGTGWIKEWPELPNAPSADAIAASFNTAFRIRRLDENTVLVQIPSFDTSQAERIDSLFAAGDTLLRNARDLIVDVRGNGGGSDYNYRHLMPLLYTNPIVTKSVAMYATPTNLQRLRDVVSSPSFPAGLRSELQPRIDSMQKHLGGWSEEPDETTTFPTVLANPKRVAIIMDRGCGSTCEQFVLAARQSRKVTLYGSRTAGVLDFANVLSAPLPECSVLQLHYATSRSKRLPAEPVDPNGIQPNVPIPPDEPLPIDFVRRRLR